jgi:hypothetical protein
LVLLSNHLLVAEQFKEYLLRPNVLTLVVIFHSEIAVKEDQLHHLVPTHLHKSDNNNKRCYRRRHVHHLLQVSVQLKERYIPRMHRKKAVRVGHTIRHLQLLFFQINFILFEKRFQNNAC